MNLAEVPGVVGGGFGASGGGGGGISTLIHICLALPPVPCVQVYPNCLYKINYGILVKHCFTQHFPLGRTKVANSPDSQPDVCTLCPVW